MPRLDDVFGEWLAARTEGSPDPKPKRGPRPRPGIVPLTSTQRTHRHRAPLREMRLRNVAVLDMETEPFPEAGDAPKQILPFTCELYSDQFEPIVIWEEDFECFVQRVYDAIVNLPGEFTIYAHNGGKFDFMFLVRMLRGSVKFKGRAIMSAKLPARDGGFHELRDSLHILPEKLAAWKKDHFDYSKLLKHRRRKFKAEILAYQHSDCVYLFDIIKRFVGEFGLKISIGQAAFAELRKHYKVEHIKETMDTALRPYFFGGRVECIAGRGVFDSAARVNAGGFKLYDVNSMYPWAMAHRPHPISTEYNWRRGQPGPDTVFIDLSCRNYGALVARGELGEASADMTEGRFQTTIFEYEIAKKYDLIDKVQIHWVIDNGQRTTFEKFIVPMYLRRQETKRIMRDQKNQGLENSTLFEETKKEDLLLKYLLNNSFGKFAQNPRNFKEYFYTNAGAEPDREWLEFLATARELIERHAAGQLSYQGVVRDVEVAKNILHRYSMPVERTPLFDIWAKPSPGRRFNNVGTAASITGAARASLLEARVNSIEPIYCDTDSLICRELKGVDIDPSRLGAWDLEESFDAVIVAGKKQYCCAVAGKADHDERRLKVRCKGADLRVQPRSQEARSFPLDHQAEWELANRATWKNFEMLLDGETLNVRNKAPTMKKNGEQHYITRRIRATAPVRSTANIMTQRARA